jgi:hypothetical protein
MKKLTMNTVDVRDGSPGDTISDTHSLSTQMTRLEEGLSHRQAVKMIERAQRDTQGKYPSITGWCGEMAR